MSLPTGERTRPGAPNDDMMGRITFVDNAVDTSTGTIRVKGEVPNAAHRLWPGQYVTVRMTLRTIPGAIVIPQNALIIRGNERSVYVVKDDGTVDARHGAAALQRRRGGRRRRARGRREGGGRGQAEPAAGVGGARDTLRARAARAEPEGRRLRCHGRAGQRHVCGSFAVNFTEVFIRRPVMTVLLNIAIVMAGVVALRDIPVAALPRYNTPVIQVTAYLPGAEPDTMASSVALPLEKQFSTIAGLTTISSNNTLGQTAVVLEFDTARDIDAAAVDVQAALFRAQRTLPAEMTTPPSYRKVNPADAPVLIISLRSPSISLSELNDFAENLISPTLSTIDGVAQVLVLGQKRFAVRIRVRPEALTERNITLDELRAAVTSANANTPVGVLDGPRQTLTVQANRQLTNAREFGNIIVANRGDAPIRLRDVADVQDSFETVKTASTFNGEPSITLAVLRQPDANTVKVVDRVKLTLPRLQAQMPASVMITAFNDRSVSIRAALHDVNCHAGADHRAGGAGDLPVPAAPGGHA